MSVTSRNGRQAPFYMRNKPVVGHRRRPSAVYVITLPGAGSLFWSGLEEEEVESGFIPEAFASFFSPS